ncbi:cadherin EGF LAG seven-pass G-type receptor 1 [Diachasma alloeum]|uniref:cadherin EGF LAG seven-pass G-type receptor 1 n=1 Tax=Diachasma alloeum TaxID=454923 RepID=UPI0007384590|nr:cadherin EGF LAG seven-pass G-type receptor 1 [Diachasma alloeum]
MTIAPKHGLIFPCLLIGLITSSQANWNSPPFEKPDPIDDTVKFVSSSSVITNIELKEEVEHAVCIAQLNYEDSTEPQLGSFSTGQSFILGAEFRKNEATKKWDLYITKKQDYETPAMRQYRFEVVVGTDRNDVALNIINIDDNPPVIQAVERTCAIEENFSGRSNCSFRISDADGWIDQTVITFTSTPESGSENFEFTRELIPSNNYEMKVHLDVIEPLDFEKITTYTLQVKATDSGKNEGTLLNVVQVIDMPDMPPVWSSLTASQSIVEKTLHTFAVSAIDGDIQINAEINYKIEPEQQEERDLFSVETKTGKITINPIDRDTLKKEVFRFSIIAYEKENITSKVEGTIVIIVEDVNDHSPVITPQELTIAIKEATYMTLDFPESIIITDPDLAENGQYSVSLTDHSEHKWSSAFVVVPTSGYQSGTFTISVLNASLLDYEDEKWRNMEIEIKAVEVANRTHIGRRTVTINLTNWNDEYPIFENDSVEVEVLEDVPRGHPITTMLATDRDVDDRVTHELISQKGLAINETTGAISTAIDDALDYETMPIVVVQVMASDLVKHKVYATLTIKVIDVNDVPPKLVLPKEIASLIEEKPVGTVVEAIIEASDVDTDADLVFSIDWDKTTAQKNGVPVNESLYRDRLAIAASYPEGHHRSAEGRIVIKGRIDYEAFDVIFLNIIVTDIKTVHNDNSTSASLTLKIIDINDNAPVFNEVEALRVTENAITDILIGTVTATDADGPEFNKISYSIKAVNNTEDDLISIDQKTGTIRVKSNETIDAEKYEYIYYEVIASDGENNTTLTLPIYVIDMNDEVPYLLNDKFNSTIHILEKSASGTEIVTIYGSDGDRTSPYNNVSYLINENYPALFQYFELSRFDGVLRVHLTDNHILDRDFGEPRYTLNLKLRDNYLQTGITWNTNAIDKEITVILDDINDQIPKLPNLGDPAKEVNENEKQNTRILKITADDKDDPATDNTKVSYKILSNSLVDGNSEVQKNCGNLFSMETEELKSAIISAARDLKGCYGTWKVEVYAQDHGTFPGPLNDTRIYHIKVTDYNYNDPVIEFPARGTRIPLSLDQTLHTKLKTYDKQPLPDFNATDDDFGASGTVVFSVSSPTGDDYFEIIEAGKNSAQLQLKQWPTDVEQNSRYMITLTAKDNGDPPREVSQEHTIIFVSARGPEFKENDWDVWIKENKTGLDFWTIIPEAVDNIGDDGSNIVPTYYFIDNKAGDFKYFALDKSTRNLTVAQELDREKQAKMNILVITTADSDGPPRDPRPEAVLNITVFVLDENDNAPVFKSHFYSGGVAVEDVLDKVILTVEATDVDLNDTVRYALMEGSLTTSDSSIASVTNPFSLDTSQGDVLLKFSATSNMAGFFKLDIAAHDTADHSDKTTVQIYIISKSNRVVFTLRNNAAFVSAEKLFIIDIFSRTFGYICNVDDIKSSVDANNHVMDNMTTLTTHFINSKDNLPIDADAIILASSDLQTVTNLKANLQARGLYLSDVPTGSSPEDSDNEDRAYWTLLSLTIIFGFSTIAVFVIYILRTRNLTQRLDKMAVDWKTGEDEIGKEKNGVVPTTNQFATAGSNPIWNVSKKSEDFDDNVSRRSGDSDLIGIEENPDFGYANTAFVTEKDAEINQLDNAVLFPQRPTVFSFDPTYSNGKSHEDKC